MVIEKMEVSMNFYFDFLGLKNSLILLYSFLTTALLISACLSEYDCKKEKKNVAVVSNFVSIFYDDNNNDNSCCF